MLEGSQRLVTLADKEEHESDSVNLKQSVLLFNHPVSHGKGALGLCPITGYLKVRN